MLRRSGIVRSGGSEPEEGTPEAAAQPAVDTTVSAERPAHFSEDLLIPGLTHTGAEIEAGDEEEGRHPEGV